MSKYIPQIGDVIMDKGIPAVVVSMRNNEFLGSLIYDREYFLCEEKYIRECGCTVAMDKIKEHGRCIHITGTVFPNIEQVTDIAPYEIQPTEAFNIRQKKAKTVTIYE